MSRTYRTHLEWKILAHGRYWTHEEENEWLQAEGYHTIGYWAGLGWSGHYRIDRRARDRKPWGKPPKRFKRPRRREEKAKVKDAMAKGLEIPPFHKSDRWDWT